MKDPATGAFGVITLVVALGAQAAALPAVVGRGPLGGARGRARPRRRTGRVHLVRPHHRPGGRRRAGSAPSSPAPSTWSCPSRGRLGLAAASVVAVPDRPWQGPVALVVAAGAAVVLAWHAVRRLGGVNGDVFGGVCEVTVTTSLAVLALG